MDVAADGSSGAAGSKDPAPPPAPAGKAKAKPATANKAAKKKEETAERLRILELQLKEKVAPTYPAVRETRFCEVISVVFPAQSMASRLSVLCTFGTVPCV